MGIGEVNRVLTAYNCEGIELPAQPDFPNCFVIYPLSNIPKQLHAHEYIGIREEELNCLFRKEYQALIPKMVV